MFILFSNNKNIFILNKCIFIVIFFQIFEYKYILYFFKNFILIDYIANINLINGVVLIHPILIYLTYVLFIIFIFTYKFNFKQFNKILFFIKLFKIRLFLFSFTALFLGGWWAQQELNWGGWWNWDFVEIIALIFNVLTLCVIHTNFFKNYNFITNINKNVVFYLIFFFLFIRFDVLNSIHSFNSFSILNNFNLFVHYFIYFIIFCILYIIFFIKNKFTLNKHSINILLFFFKFVNSLLLIYIFVNLFFILYLNFQFIDITKYVKYIILLILYIILILEFLNINILIINFLCFLFFINIDLHFYLDVFILLTIVYFNKYVSNFNRYVLLTHFLFAFFIFYIKYNIIYNYSYTSNLNFNKFFIKTFFLESFDNTMYYNNNNSIFFNNLLNYYYNVNYNSFYYNSVVHVNNIIVNNNVYCYYNIDSILILFFYKFNLIFYNIVFLFLFL